MLAGFGTLVTLGTQGTAADAFPLAPLGGIKAVGGEKRRGVSVEARGLALVAFCQFNFSSTLASLRSEVGLVILSALFRGKPCLSYDAGQTATHVKLNKRCSVRPWFPEVRDTLEKDLRLGQYFVTGNLTREVGRCRMTPG